MAYCLTNMPLTAKNTFLVNDCTFYSHIRFPYSTAEKQHEYATQICKAILREHPEFEHTGPYPLGYNYCGDIPGMVIFNVVKQTDDGRHYCYNYAFISNQKLGYTYACPFFKSSRCSGRESCLTQKSVPLAFAIVEQYFLDHVQQAEKIEEFPQF